MWSDLETLTKFNIDPEYAKYLAGCPDTMLEEGVYADSPTRRYETRT